MPDMKFCEEQVQHFNAVMALMRNVKSMPLVLNNMEIQILSQHHSIQGPGMKFLEHEHTYYEFSFMILGSMSTAVDTHRVECAAGDNRILAVPPLVPHRRTFGEEGININQSLNLSITGIDDAGKACCMKLCNLISRKKYCLSMTPELSRLQKEMQRQVEISAQTSPLVILHLLYAFITILFQQNFASLFEEFDKTCLSDPVFFEMNRLETIKRLVMNEMERKTPQAFFEKRFGMSVRQLNRIFKKGTGLTIAQYQTEQKMARARELLCDLNIPIARIAQSLGFRNHIRFTTFFSRHQGCSPSQFRMENQAYHLCPYKLSEDS